jgi:glycosyltransferase involved in cell wall biosynthesis
MEKLSSNASLRQDLMEKGLERAAKFNWEFSAEQFYKILKKSI